MTPQTAGSAETNVRWGQYVRMAHVKLAQDLHIVTINKFTQTQMPQIADSAGLPVRAVYPAAAEVASLNVAAFPQA